MGSGFDPPKVTREYCPYGIFIAQAPPPDLLPCKYRRPTYFHGNTAGGLRSVKACHRNSAAGLPLPSPLPPVRPRPAHTRLLLHPLTHSLTHSPTHSPTSLLTLPHSSGVVLGRRGCGAVRPRGAGAVQGRCKAVRVRDGRSRLVGGGPEAAKGGPKRRFCDGKRDAAT